MSRTNDRSEISELRSLVKEAETQLRDCLVVLRRVLEENDKLLALNVKLHEAGTKATELLHRELARQERISPKARARTDSVH